MSVEKNDMKGRSLSDKPSIGVPLALNNLQNLKLLPNEKYSCLCYLGYRVLDKYDISQHKDISENYSNVDFLMSEIARYKNKLHQTSFYSDFIDTRWFICLSMIDIYMRFIIKGEIVSEKELSFFDTSRHIEKHPRCFVNIIRICCMLYLMKAKDSDPFDLLLRIIEYYKMAISSYKTHVRPESRLYIVYESYEAIDVIMSTMNFLKNKDESINRWHLCSANVSVKYINQCLLMIAGRKDLIIQV